MLDQKQKAYNWYFTQCFVITPDDAFSKHTNFVTFADTPDEAKALAREECAKRHPTMTDVEVCLYQKNYIKDSRIMVEQGNYVGNKPAHV